MAVWSSMLRSGLEPSFRLDAEYYNSPGARLRHSLDEHGIPFSTYFHAVIHPPEFVRDYVDKPGHAFLRAQNVKPGLITNPDPVYVSESIYSGLSGAITRTDEMLLVRTGANLGDLARVPLAWTEAMVSSHTLRLVPQPNAPVCALEFFFVSDSGRALLCGLRSGGTHGQINAENLKSLKLPKLSAFEATARVIAKKIENCRLLATVAFAEAESLLMDALGLGHLDLTSARCYERSFSDLQGESRFDAEFFKPKYQQIIEKLRVGGRTLADVAPLTERPFAAADRQKDSTFRYIEIGSLTGDGEAESETLDVADAPSRATWIVKPGDIITSTVRPIRRLSAMVRDDQDGCVCSSGFAVLAPKPGPDGIEPEVLLTYLRLPPVCEILDLHTTATMYPAIPTDRLMRMPIVVPDKATRDTVVQKVQAAIAARRQASKLLDQAKQTVEELIANGEGSAL